MRLLIANPFGIGDVLFSFPLVHAVREADPRGYLGYLCNRRTAELVANEKTLNWHIVFEKDEFREAWRRSKREGIRYLGERIRAVRQQHFELFVDLSLGWQMSGSAWLAGIPRRIGFDFHGRGRSLTQKLPISGFHDQPVADYYLDLLPLLGMQRRSGEKRPISIPPSIELQAEGYLSSIGCVEGKPLVALVPGGGASWGPYAHYKQWVPESFVEVANSVSTRYGAQIVLIGDSQEASLCQKVGRLLVTAPRYAIQVPSLLLLAALLKRCHLVIGNDSGVMHIASTVGAKTVTLFGPVDGSVYGPFLPQAHQRVVAKGLACRPCYQAFRLPPCPWGNACLKELASSDVIRIINEVLSAAIA